MTDRRSFLLGSAGAATGLALGAGGCSTAEVVSRTKAYDVVVAGGGPAGVSAACAAARSGARVMLLELQGALGGIWTSGLLGCVLDFGRSRTAKEIIVRLDALGARHAKEDADFPYEPEYMKYVLEGMCAASGVEFQLHTMVTGAEVSGRMIRTVETHSKSGLERWQAKVFVDATGDGDLAALAGCGFDLGSRDGFDQPASLDAILAVRDAAALAPYTLYSGRDWASATGAFRDELLRAGIKPSYGMPTLYRVHDHLLVMMANHEYHVRLDDAAAVTAATVRARRENIEMVAALARLGGPWSGVRVVATAEQLGHRTARRIHGRYTVNREDVIAGRYFEDGVADCRFPVDIHAEDVDAAAVSNVSVKAKPFQIPLRALMAKDVDNLFLSGRCISGDYVSHAAYRVTGPAVATGEAAGRAAARRALGGQACSDAC